jgi:poly(3-hydroxybutyrate) depolymerase
MRILSILLLLPLASAPAQDIVFTKGLVIRSAPGFPDNIAGKDPIEAALVAGSWRSPRAGDEVRYNDTLAGVWEEVRGDSMGWFDDPLLGGGAYLYFELDVPRRQKMILLPMGSSMSYVNGIPRAGNPYGMKETWERWEPPFDYALLPVELFAGKNWFLFPCTRGRFKARLFVPPAEVFLNAKDCTLPDLIEAAPYEGFGAIVVVNATARTLKGLHIESSLAGCSTSEKAGVIQPMSVRKVPFPIRCRSALPAGRLPLSVRLLSGGRVLDSAVLEVRVVRRAEAHRVTFLSGIDGSVQFYAVLPASGEESSAALVLSLHGAGVDALNQAASYEAKSWAHIVCPTNRRPYGFNWEDWGRVDALEVLGLARSHLQFDESRVYLTGHSMGGHGAYHLGSLFPDRFAAVGPSAGWISFWSYRVRERFENPSPMRQMLMRPALASDTYTFARNFSAVYILHGSDDDNVPVEQSRAMARHLGTFHRDWLLHEEPGVGHWWDRSDEPGADCVDWAPMFDFFARHARPEQWRIREVHFATPSPGVSSRCDWASIDAQLEQWKLSRVDLRIDPGARRIVGGTENVRRLSFRLSALLSAGTVGVSLDSQTIAGVPWPADGNLRLERKRGAWSVAGVPAANLKRPERYGAFRDAFGNNVALIYGTMGSAEENLWAFAKARFDAERFWYQGNGSIEVLADTECTAATLGARNVVLYGNAGTHRLWGRLLGDSPVQVGEGRVSAGGRVFRGRDIACVFIRPRGERFSVGVVSGTGLTGMRATNRMPYLLPGIGFPDLLLSRASSYEEGEKALLGAGFFGDDWSLDGGEFVWREE